MAWLERLDLTDFRNWARLRFSPGAPIAVITGPNGSGKTNLLEALSYLVPGRGLRGAKLPLVGRRGAGGGFAVAGQFTQGSDMPPFAIATGYTPPSHDHGHGKRRFLLNGAAPGTQADIASLLAAVWVTPQMDQLFEDSASGRRRFLDRLVMALEPQHGREVAAHDASVTRRNKLLAAPAIPDPAWLAAIEDSIARHAIAVAAARLGFVQVFRNNAASAGFPAVEILLADPIAERLAREPAIAAESWLRAELATRRSRDREAGNAALGAHRADMMLANRETGEPAISASTGQRRTLLLGTILTHAAMIRDARGFAPMLLLDEPLVHLDQTRREALFEALWQTGAQVVMTGTDADVFAPLRGRASFWQTSGGQGFGLDPLGA
jgi:DNA replication and repair protein RecF